MINVFLLVRDEDETGVSGTGVVAAGMECPDGHVIMRWLVGEHRSSVTWDSMKAVQAIHGHGGKTRVVWLGSFHPNHAAAALHKGRPLSLDDAVMGAYRAKVEAISNFDWSSHPKAEFRGLEAIIKSPFPVAQRWWNSGPIKPFAVSDDF